MNEPSDWPTPNYEDPDLAGSLEGSLATSIILGSIAVAAVIARLWSRFRILHRVGLDDMLIVIALGFGITFNVYHEIGIQRDGYGRHIWDIPFHKIELLARGGLIATELYLLATAFIKISILFFYRRLLQGSHGELFIYKRINYALMVAVIIYVVATGFSVLFTCNPVEALWRKADPQYALTTTFSCRDNRPTLLAIAYCSLLTDIAIVTFPLIFIRLIQIRRSDRWALRSLFFVCIFACIAAIIRVAYQHLQYFDGDDLTYHGFYSLLWGTVEVYVSIACASAPALKPFFGKYLPDLTNRSNPTSKNSNRMRPFRQSSSRKVTNENSELARKEQDTESGANIELVNSSKTTKPWDARSREFNSQKEPKETIEESAGVLKRVDVEVQYLNEEPKMNQMSPSERV